MSFVICSCPRCGAEVGTDDLAQPYKLYWLVAILLVHAALVDSLLDAPEYALTKEGWNERIEELSKRLEEESTEMVQFGSAFDGNDADEDEDEED